MSILSCVPLTVGAVGVNPRAWAILTNNTFAEVTTAGYLTNEQSKYGFLSTDYAQVYTTDIATIELSINVSSAGVVSLVYNNDSALVTLPVVSGDFTVFDGTTGKMKDAGYSASNAAKTKVVMASAAVTSGNLASFSDTAGTVIDSTIVATTVMKLNAVNTLTSAGSIVANKVSQSESGGIVNASGMSGVITTSSLTTIAGGSTLINWTNTFVSTTSTIFLSVLGGTNTRRNVEFVVVPGSGSAALTIYNVEPTNALNGTILIGYLVI